MFRKLYNQASFSGRLEPDGPVLIVEGGASVDPLAVQLAFVRTRRNGQSTVYLPGSSLKGVLRAHAERILRTCLDTGSYQAAEDPFVTDAPRRSKAGARKKDGDTAGVYRASCEADRLFGSTVISGRFRIGDAYPPETDHEAANRTEVRNSVAIDRSKQSVKHGPFDQEAVVGGSFEFKAVLENFELWMLALVLQVFSDLHEGLIQIGHAKTRGFGTMRVLDPELELRWPGHCPTRLEGAGAREPDRGVREAYGLSEKDFMDLPPNAVPIDRGMLSGYRYTSWDQVEAVRNVCGTGPWRQYLSRVKELY